MSPNRAVLIYGDDEESRRVIDYIKKNGLEGKVERIHTNDDSYLKGPVLITNSLIYVGFRMIKRYLDEWRVSITK